jgi:hypothetical protein
LDLLLPAPSPVPEIIDLDFAKTSPKHSFSVNENVRLRACFRENWVYKFGHRHQVVFLSVFLCVVGRAY